MRRVSIRILSVVIILFIILSAVFISGGGLQFFKTSKLPDVVQSTSFSSDLAYFRALVLANESGASEQQYERFNLFVDSAAEPKDVDELSLIVSQALSVFDNAHTMLITPKMYRLPVRFH